MNKIIEQYKELIEKPKIAYIGKKKRIVMLLGAGFSIDQGYPKADDVANKIKAIKDGQYVFTTDGTLCVSNNSIKKETGNYYQKIFSFLLDLIALYTEKLEGNFDYEAFYDIINLPLRKIRPGYKPNFNIFSDECRKIGKKYTDELLSYEKLLLRLPVMYNQLIESVIKEEGNPNMFYGDTSTCISNYPKYTNFLYFLMKMSKSNIIDVFTLNHDLFFDSFKNIAELRDEVKSHSLISDGFDEYGSEFFGTIKYGDNYYRCRLERYTGRYNTPIRLYKLHGSFDYVLCYKTKRISNGNIAFPLKYIKTKNGMLPFSFEKSTRCKMKYEQCLTDYCESFLSGTESKTLQYADELLYAKLFRRFDKCLENTDRLIIIGYSANDDEINDHIISHFSYKNGKCDIIDYNPGDNLMNLAKQINAKIYIGKINEQIKNIEQ